MTLLRKLKCPIGDDCPALTHVVHDDGREVVRVTGNDPNNPGVEIDVDADPSLFPGLLDLRITDWPAWLREHRKTPGDMLRVQTLPQYGVPSDDEDYRRYVAGEAAPASKHRGGWFLKLEAERAAGQTRRNLHVVDGMTDYLRYAFEWGYAYNVEHGQRVRILDVSESPVGAAMLRLGDYWVVEGQHVVQCRYTPEGVPDGLVRVEAAGAQGYIAAGEMAWDQGIDFEAWWGAHPEYHRTARRAA